MKTKMYLPLALLALAPAAWAQDVPGAGSQLRQLPPAPLPQQVAPDIRIEQATAPPTSGESSVRVLVNALHVSGEQVFSEAELVGVTGFRPGSQLSLADLQAMASRITEFYRSHGYFVAQAFLPAQKVIDHQVTIAVSEGRYGKVTLNNSSNLSSRLARSRLDGLNTGDPITIRPLENRLLLLSDVPGVHVSSTLSPGATPGTSDLLVDVTPGRRVTGSVDADNAGNPYTGEYRIGATVNLNNPLGLGDVASLRVLTSGRGLRYGRASYQLQAGRATVGVAYSRLEYVLGKQFRSLRAHGSADVASVYGYYPLMRSRNTSLTAGLVYEEKSFRDHIDLFQSVSDRRAHVLTAQLYGSQQDGFGGGGVTSLFVGLSLGSLDIRTPAARAADAVSAQTEGSYRKAWFNVARLQRVTDLVSLYGSFTGQVASKNLDPSEKLVLGGMDGVRAYPQGEGFGDAGYLASLEARLLLAGVSAHVPGQVHLLAFVDTGHININERPWYAGPNSRTLSSVGVGATWEDAGNFSVRTYYARKLGSEPAISAPDRSGRFWIQAIKYF
ncbi:ShlB/FhaC/HecB family hemolysin secretion/activation protein [Rhodanobacter ginsengiterrae]|uniref:ShlB/FhaC/HecB family hemolysin secretion/activation protein n=1 Tax=Rhodanobacter ginsengiterrae TaxID=2008451 RepID=UPI003CF91CB9